MDRLFRVVALDVRELPYVARVLSFRITGQFAGVRSLEVALAGVLGRYADRVEVPGVVVAGGPPVDGFVPSGEPPAAVQAVAEVPDDAVAQAQAAVPEQRVEQGVEGDDLPVLHVVADLPADRPVRVQEPRALADHALLGFAPSVERGSGLVFLAQVVGGRRYDQLEAAVGQRTHEVQVVGAGELRPILRPGPFPRPQRRLRRLGTLHVHAPSILPPSHPPYSLPGQPAPARPRR